MSYWPVINDATTGWLAESWTPVLPPVGSMAEWTSDQCGWQRIGRCHVVENGFSTWRTVRRTQWLFVNASASVAVAGVSRTTSRIKTSPADADASSVYVSICLCICMCLVCSVRHIAPACVDDVISCHTKRLIHGLLWMGQLIGLRYLNSFLEHELSQRIRELKLQLIVSNLQTNLGIMLKIYWL